MILKKILVAILEDSLVYLDNQKLINNQILNRVVSIYFLLIDYDYKNMVEFDDLNIKEKKLIYKIVLDGVASMYVDNEYLQFSDVGTKYKRKIIQELLSFFKYISKTEISDGFTPLILDACPILSGLTSVNFCFASVAIL